MAKDDKFLARVREWQRQTEASESDSRLRRATELKFLLEGGEYQWPEYAKSARTIPGQERPLLTDNRVLQFYRSVTNQIKANRPALKVRPVDDNADVKTSEILQGLIRNIEAVSKADIATTTAADFSVATGLGYFGLMTKYVADDSWDQDIAYRLIPDPMKVYFDPYSVQPDGSDATRAMIVEDLPREEFERNNQEIKFAPWDGGANGDLNGWLTENTIRVAEYYEIQEEKATLFLLEDGNAIWEEEYLKLEAQAQQWAQDNPPPPMPPQVPGQPPAPPPMPPVNPMQPAKVVNQRTTSRKRCHWYKLAGDQILDQTVIPTQFIPIIPVYGAMYWSDGERHVSGIVSQAKDPQRMLNFWISAMAEQIALQPKVPYIAPEGSFEGHEDKWRTANNHNHAYLEYTVVTEGGQVMPRPERQPPPPVPTGYVEQMQMALDGIKAAVGMQDPAIGAPQSADQSGIAIRRLQQQAAIGTAHFATNLALSVEHAGRIILEMIPEIYDTKRVVRILGEDGEPSHAVHDPSLSVAMQKQQDATGAIKTIYNLGVGKYDVQVDVGPTYGTKRQEGFQAMTEMMRVFPPLGQVAGDLIMRLSDAPYSDEMADRMKAAIPPQILQATENQDDNPALSQAQMQIQQMGQQMQQMGQQLQQLEAENQSKQMEFQAKIQDAQVRMAEAEVKKQELMVKMGELQQAQNPDQAQIQAVFQHYQELQTVVQQLAEENQGLKEQMAMAGDEAEEKRHDRVVKLHDAMLKEREMKLKERQAEDSMERARVQQERESVEADQMSRLAQEIEELRERANAPAIGVVGVKAIRDKQGKLIGAIKQKSDGTEEKVDIND